MDCNRYTSWDEYSDLSEDDTKQNEDQFIIDAKIDLFLRKYTSFPLEVKIYLFLIILQKEELIEVFVQSNFNEESINLILEKKLIEKLKNKKEEKIEEEKLDNKSKVFSWKDNNNDNNRFFKKSRFDFNNYYSKSHFFKNKKHFKNDRFYNNNKYYYIEKEMELNSNDEKELDSHIKFSEFNEDNNKFDNDKNTDSNYSFNSQENTEEMTNYELSNLNLINSNVEDLSYNAMLNYQDVGIRLFPGVFHLEKKDSFDQNNTINNKLSNQEEKENNNLDKNINIKINDENNKKNFECNNYICKNNYNLNKKEQKLGLALALEYYSSFLESKNINQSKIFYIFVLLFII